MCILNLENSSFLKNNYYNKQKKTESNINYLIIRQ